jgi:hypothetical protein
VNDGTDGYIDLEFIDLGTAHHQSPVETGDLGFLPGLGHRHPSEVGEREKSDTGSASSQTVQRRCFGEALAY